MGHFARNQQPRVLVLTAGAVLLAGAVLATGCGIIGGADPTPTPTATAEPVAVQPTRPPAPTPSGPTPVPPDEVAEQNADPSIPGVYYPPHPGPDSTYGTDDDRAHVPNVVPICSPSQLASGLFYSPLCYPSNPPTSGPHASFYPRIGVQSQPVPKEQLVHSMEHGAVVIWANTTNENIWADLVRLTNDAVAQRRLVVLSRYSEMEPETIALTSWTRIDKFPAGDYTQERVVRFVLANERRFNPEGF